MIRSLLASCLLLLSVGCNGLPIHTPEGFAELGGGDGYTYRATSAEGAVLGVRREDNDPHGNLAFWSTAVDAELRRRGYTATAASDVKSDSGVAGRELRYRVVRDGRPHVLCTTVYVTDAHVTIVESGGDEAHFGEHERELVAAARSVEPS